MRYYASESAGDYYPLQTVTGNKNPVYNTIISGTYVREELFLDIACWLSQEFYMKCGKIIEFRKRIQGQAPTR
jgi:KilA-N domain.